MCSLYIGIATSLRSPLLDIGHGFGAPPRNMRIRTRDRVRMAMGAISDTGGGIYSHSNLRSTFLSITYIVPHGLLSLARMVLIKSEDLYRALPAECYEIKARMDRRRDVVRQELTALALDQRRLNGLRPVAKLGRHTLTKIFMMVMGPMGDGRQYGMPETIAFKPYHWLYITHVCHRWRTVALETTAFWTQLYFAKPEWIEQLLARSRDAPLKFSFMIPPIPNRVCRALSVSTWNSQRSS
ncbi:hypothetical protein K474DRAFT_756421 [Panus rudis PR-1116 ss-1]|nr:hypothetical protein K474DRAFT_756421 [Panus rudis PR-1116 ss-1]